MPQYCYRSKTNKVIEKTFSIKDSIPRMVTVDRTDYHRSFQDENASTQASSGWPMECCASGVHPDQAGELRREFDKQGVPTEVTEGGDPIYRNAKHRKRALTCRGLHDKSSYN